MVERAVFVGNAMKIFKRDRGEKKNAGEVFPRDESPSIVGEKIKSGYYRRHRRRDKGQMCFSRQGQGLHKGRKG